MRAIRLAREKGGKMTFAEREECGKFAGICGVMCNLILFAAKFAVGTVFGSISVVADAVNNISDAFSSVIATVSFKISGKPADAEHPYGHRRIEYIASMLVSVIIIFIGYELILSSIQKIINPSETEFSMLTVAVLAFSMAVKLLMNAMYRYFANATDSSVLRATAQDSINDVYSTAAVLLSVFFAKFSGKDIDGYMGVGISLFIIYSGISLIKDTLDPLLGESPDCELVHKIQDKILSYRGIIGIHDLMVHSYGPGRTYVSVHAEVPASEDVLVSHDIIDNIEHDFLKNDGINLVIHMDPIVTDDENVTKLKKEIADILNEIESSLTFHDFRVVFGQSHTNLIFDVVVPFGNIMTDRQLENRICESVADRLGDGYYCVITFDRPYVR